MRFGSTLVFHVNGDKKKAYIVATGGRFYEFHLTAGDAHFVADLKKLEPELSTKRYLYGHDAWDGKGRFFFTSFNERSGNVVLVAIDPDRLAATLNK